MKIPTPTLPNHGPKITREESDRRSIELARKYEMPSKTQELEVKRATMDVMIDHKLGQHFPQDRRDRLWGYQEGFHKSLLLHTAKAFVVRPWDPMGSLGKDVVKRFAKELSMDELKQYFDYTEEEINRFLGK